MIRTLTLLNERGDTTLAWDEDSDEQMVALIDAKIKEGMTFFLLKPKAKPTVKQKKLKSAKDALPDRAVVMSDQDFAEMLTSGAATATDAPEGELEVVDTATTGADVVKHGTAAAAKPMRGG